MALSRASFFLFSLLFLALGICEAAQCSNGIFNLCALRPSLDYTASDADYNYYVNFAAPLLADYGNCSRRSGVNVVQRSRQDPNRCYFLAKTDPQSIDFIDSYNYMKGAKVSYTQGMDGRSVQLIFPCDASVESNQVHIVNASEPSVLRYVFLFSPSKAACPIAPSTINVPTDGSTSSVDVDVQPGNFTAYTFTIPTNPTLRAFSVHLTLSLPTNTTPVVTSFLKFNGLGSQSDYGQRRYLSRSSSSLWMNVTGEPNVFDGTYFLSFQGGAIAATVNVKITTEKCIVCSYRGTADCASQTCTCRPPYILPDCSGELKNLTLATQIRDEFLFGTTFQSIYAFQVPAGKLEIHAVVQSNNSRFNTPLLYLTMDPYSTSTLSDANLMLPGFAQQRSLRYMTPRRNPLIEGTYYIVAKGYPNRTQFFASKYNLVVNSYECPNNCAGSLGGYCNVETHKCACQSGRTLDDCSLETQAFHLNEKRDIRVAADSWLYTEFKGEEDLDLGCIDISVILKNKHRTKANVANTDELSDVILYVGDGFMPTKSHYYATSQRLELDPTDINNSTVVFGEGEEDDDEQGVISHNMQMCSVSFPGLVKKGKLFYVGVYNGDTKTHEMTLSISRLGNKGVAGVSVFFLAIVMLVIGGAVGYFLTRYRGEVTDFAKRSYEYVASRGKTSFGASRSSAPASYATVSQDEEGLLGTNDDANEDVFD